MTPEELGRLVPGLSGKSHSEKIKLFGWYLHVHRRVAHFQPADIKGLYEKLHMAAPTFGGYFQQLMREGSLLKNSSGYRLENRIREALDTQYGMRDVTIQVTQLLASLPDKIPDLAERTFLNEALICFRHGAFRAAVVMTWNLAYHHLCDYALRKHLTDFNDRWFIVYPGHHNKRPGRKTIAKMDDFAEELMESEVIEICNSAGIITNDIRKILSQKLGRRNSAAHPSSVSIGQLQAEDFIDDLIKNVVLKLV
jgi:hypothetical protein